MKVVNICKLFQVVFFASCFFITCDRQAVNSKNCCTGPVNDLDSDGIPDGTYIEEMYQKFGDTLSESKRQSAIENGKYDTVIDCIPCQE